MDSRDTALVSSRTRSRCLRTEVRDLLLLFAVPPRIRRNNPRTVFHPPSPCHARPWLSSRTRSRCLRTGVRDLLLLFAVPPSIRRNNPRTGIPFSFAMPRQALAVIPNPVALFANGGEG